MRPRNTTRKSPPCRKTIPICSTPAFRLPKMRRREAGRRRLWRVTRNWPMAQPPEEFEPRRRSRRPLSPPSSARKNVPSNSSTSFSASRRAAIGDRPHSWAQSGSTSNWATTKESPNWRRRPPRGCPTRRAQRFCCSREIPSDNLAVRKLRGPFTIACSSNSRTLHLQQRRAFIAC